MYNNSRDVEFFLGDYFFGAPCSRNKAACEHGWRLVWNWNSRDRPSRRPPIDHQRSIDHETSLSAPDMVSSRWLFCTALNLRRIPAASISWRHSITADCRLNTSDACAAKALENDCQIEHDSLRCETTQQCNIFL